MAVWRRKPPAGLLVHSGQGSQFAGQDWQDFLKAHGLVSSMSRRGSCRDNAVAESFFQLLKRERIKRRIYVTREEAKSDVFNCIEMFYNTRRQHGHNDGLSPVEFEKQQSKRGFGVSTETGAIQIECVGMFRGALDGALVHPREAVKEALRLNAAAVILAYPHPSGYPEPSHADKAITLQLKDALALIGVRTLDHIVVGGNDTVSLAERGLL